MLNKSAPVSSRTRSRFAKKRKIQDSDEDVVSTSFGEKKRKIQDSTIPIDLDDEDVDSTSFGEKKRKIQDSTIPIIDVDDEDVVSTSFGDEPVTSVSEEDNEDSNDLDFWLEEEEEEEDEEEAAESSFKPYEAAEETTTDDVVRRSGWKCAKPSQTRRVKARASSRIVISDSSSGDEERDFSADDEGIVDLTKSSVGKKRSGGSPKGNKNCTGRVDLVEVLVNSIWKEECNPDISLEECFCLNSGVKENTCPSEIDSDEELDPLWDEMRICLVSSQIGSTSSPNVNHMGADIPEVQLDTATLCRQGNHHLLLDEEIGLQCKYCSYVHLESRYICAPFLTEPYGKYERQSYGMEESSVFGGLDYQDPTYDDFDRCTDVQGTVWEIIPGVKSRLYPHQREGFEFIWKNIAGGIYRNKTKNSSNTCGGCIISHAPGTGKSLLTIVFLYTYLKENPRCRPVLVAPRSMLLTWEAEFKKWNVDIPFHNLNSKDFSGKEKAIGIGLYEKHKHNARDRPLAIRLVKLLSWTSDGGILGVSYGLFKRLSGIESKGKGKCSTSDSDVSRVLLELPGLFVIDEGHTPRNSGSLMWKALSKIKTERRIILSGTPFQNNFDELFNTLCLARPKFAERIQSRNRNKIEKRSLHKRKRNEAKYNWASLTCSIGKDNDRHEAELDELKAVIEPFVHVHKGTVLHTSLPGLRHSVVVLQPSDLQKEILECLKATKDIGQLVLDHAVSLISVHPSLLLHLQDEKGIPMQSLSSGVSVDELKRIRLMLDKGVKTKFLKELLVFSEALNERVIVFSQYLDPLNLIMDQLKESFKWKQGEEILYMHGQCDINHRQSSIIAFNDPTSKAKVMLASTRACSEGINLIGGSRVVLLDVTWNPSVERQAISRAYRLGQKKVVYVYRLISSGTLEGRKCYKQAGKDRLSELVFCSSDKGDDHEKEAQNVLKDGVLEEMIQHEKLKPMFEKIINHPKDCTLMDIVDF